MGRHRARRSPPFMKVRDNRMDYDPMLAAMLSQPWSNNACRGYVIYAMENCGFSPLNIRRVLAELYEVFDIRGLEEAEQHFEESPY